MVVSCLEYDDNGKGGGGADGGRVGEMVGGWGLG